MGNMVMKWRQHAWYSTVVEDDDGRSVCSAGTVEEAEQIVEDHNAQEELQAQQRRAPEP